MIKLFQNKYRVRTDRYAGFEVQTKRWWFPFWHQTGRINTHISLARAKDYLAEQKNPVRPSKSQVVYEE